MRRRSAHRLGALVLAAVLVMQTGAAWGSPQNGAPADTPPVVSYQGEHLKDGMILPEDAIVTVGYSIAGTRAELAGTRARLALPDPLLAVGDPGAVLARDESGAPLPVGELMIESGAAALHFSDALVSPIDPGPGADEAPDDAWTLGATTLGESEPKPAPEPMDNGGEVLTLSPSVRCSFDLSRIPPPKLRAALRPVTLESGGRAVTIQLLSANAAGGPLVDGPTFQNAVSIQRGALYRMQEQGADYTKPVRDGDTLSGKDNLLLRYNFELSAEQGEALDPQIGRAKYAVTIPTGLKLAAIEGQKELSLVAKVTILQDAGPEILDMQFGTLVLDSGKGAYVVFTGEFWTDPRIGVHALNDGYIELSCKLDLDAIQDGNPYLIEITEQNSCSVVIAENVKSEDKLDKKDVRAENGRFNWSVVYVPGTVEKAAPIRLVDTFDPAGQILLKDTIRINDESPADGALQVEDGTITYTLHTIPDSAVTLTYQTALSDEAVKDYSNETKVENTVQLQDKDGAVLCGPLTAFGTAAAADKRQLLKSGQPVGADGRRLRWTVTIKTQDRRLESLSMLDTLPHGLTLDPGTVRLNGSPLTAGGGFTLTPGADGKSRITLPIPRPEGGYDPVYTITYETVIGDAYFDDPSGSVTFVNEAELSYTWMRYPGTGEGVFDSFHPPSIGTGVPVNTSILEKKGVRYDPATRQLTWEVMVNPHQVDLIAGVIIDDLTAHKQTYVADSFASPSDRIALGSVSADQRVLTINVGNLGTRSAPFTFITLVDAQEKDDYAGNSLPGTLYENSAAFNGTVQVGGAVTQVQDSAAASQYVYSTVLSKESAGYDYTDNTVLWRVTLNQNGMPMENVTLEDTVEANQHFVPGSVTVSDSSITSSVTEGSPATLIALTGSIGKNTVVEYKTKLDIEQISEFESAAVVKVGNTVTLKRSGFSDVTSGRAEQAIQNPFLGKSATGPAEDGRIAYTVNINPHGRILSRANKLIDKIPAGLVLDLDSVLLYDASVTANGTFNQGAEVNRSDWKLTYSAASGDTPAQFTVELPQSSTARRYSLLYDCYIVDSMKSPFRNEITLVGSASGSGPGSSSNSVGAGGGGGGGSTILPSVKMARLNIVKKDSRSGNVRLKDVEFELYQERGGVEQLLMSGVTDREGTYSFYPLRVGQEYILKEVRAPAGYDAGQSTGALTGGSGSLDDAQGPEWRIKPLSAEKSGAQLFTVTNEPVKGTIQLMKEMQRKEDASAYDPANETTGIAFEIKDQTNGSTYTNTASVGSDGTAVLRDVPFGTYQITETGCPKDWVPVGPFKVTVGTDGTTVYTDVPNDGVSQDSATGVVTVKNDYFRPKLVVSKEFVPAGSGGGAAFTFTLTNNTSAAVPPATAAVVNGKATFTGLLSGDTYTLTENDAAGFYKPRTLEFTVKQEGGAGYTVKNGVLSLTWKNYRYDGEIQVAKVDSLRPGVKLRGVEFSLYRGSAADSATWVAGPLATDENGIVTFANIALDQDPDTWNADGSPKLKATTFWLEEVAAPDGYTGISERIKVTLTPGAPKAAETVKNTPTAAADSSFSFKKISEGGKPLTGAAFRLTDLTSGSGKTYDQVIRADATVPFTSIPLGEYSLTETVTPPYHRTMSPISITIGASGKVVRFGDRSDPAGLTDLEVTNEVYHQSLSIRKIDEEGNPKPGITFELYHGGDLPEDTRVTDANGEALFTDLLGGEEYILREVTPSGYYPTADYPFTIDKDGEQSLTWKNVALDGSITLTKVDAADERIPLQGAEYQLYKGPDAASSTPVGDTQTTGVDGTILFAGLELDTDLTAWTPDGTPTLKDTTFWLEEIAAPEGYVRATDKRKVVLSQSGRTAELKLPNEPVKADVSWKKSSDVDGRGLSGVEFTVVNTVPGRAEASYTVVSEADGTVSLAGLPFGVYTVRETIAPDYHHKAADFELEIGARGKITRFGDQVGSDLQDLKLENEAYRRTLTVEKLEENGTPMRGVTFELFHGGDVPEDAQETDGDGKAVFHVRGGERYILREKTPDGYYPGKDYSFTLEMDADITLPWYNYPQGGSITLTKVDAAREAIRLPGARFQLYRGADAATATPVGEPRETDQNGVLSFTGLALDRDLSNWSPGDPPVFLFTTFWLEEITAPEGYVKLPERQKSSLTPDRQSVSLTVKNDPVTGTLAFQKVSAWNASPLAGAAFTLTDETPGSRYTATAASRTDGSVTFENVPAGSYALRETAAPAGHVLDTQTYTARIDSAGRFVSLKNAQGAELTERKLLNDYIRASIALKKTDGKMGTPIPGVEFTVTDNAGVRRGQCVTDAWGQAALENLKRGETYTIQETAAPEGYYPAAPAEVTLTEPALSLTWKNTPYEGAITLRKTDADNPAHLLPGARFALYDGETLLDTAETGADGTLTFTGLALTVEQPGTYNRGPVLADKRYILRETGAPEGYVRAVQELTAVLTPTAQMCTLEAANSLRRANAVIRTQNDLDRRLNSVLFQLVGETAAGVPVIRETASERVNGEDGTLLFENLPVGQYTLTETKTVPYHDPNGQSYILTVGTDGSVTLTDSAQNPAGETIVSVVHKRIVHVQMFSSADNRPMGNIPLRIVDQELGETIREAVTDSEGGVTLERLEEGRAYVIVEITPPTGYYPTAGGITIVAGLDPAGNPLPPGEPQRAEYPKEPIPADRDHEDEEDGDSGHYLEPEKPGNVPAEKVLPVQGGAAIPENGKTLPNTGQERAALLVLGAAGVLLLGAGVARLRRPRGGKKK